MRHIRKKNQPGSFQRYINASNASFDDMDSDVKEDLRNSLVEEQQGVCAYCQQILRKNKIKIEHHCERSICNGQNGIPDRRLDYANLLAVCLGQGGLENELHCDSKKATFHSGNGLPITVNPINISHIQTIKYSSTGGISSSNSLYNKEIDEILNLNIPYIKAARKKKWLMIFRNSLSKSKEVNKDKMKKLLDADLATQAGSFISPFPGLNEFMKKKFC